MNNVTVTSTVYLLTGKDISKYWKETSGKVRRGFRCDLNNKIALLLLLYFSFECEINCSKNMYVELYDQNFYMGSYTVFIVML